MTLRSAELTNCISNETYSLYGVNYGFKNFLLPVTEEMDISEKDKFSVNSKTILSFSFDYKYIGKETYRENTPLGKPIVVYDNQQIFTADYMVCIENDSQKWLKWCCDPINNNLCSVQLPITYQPLDSKSYFARGMILLPKEVEKNTDKPLTIQFKELGQEYRIR